MAPGAASRSLLLVLLTLAALGGVGRNGFINFDDDAYLTANPMVAGGLTPEGLAWAFTTTHAANWHPLTWLSHQLDVTLFGLEPGPHHLVGLAIHAANGILLFLVLTGATGAPWRSFLVAALFAVHPLRVESVAWAAERKDLLAALFTLLSLRAWLAHLRAPSGGRYAPALLLYALALLAKPMAVTFPFLLFLLDWWPLGRVRPGWRPWGRPGGGPPGHLLYLVAEKFPFLLLATLAGAVTFEAQRSGGAMRVGLEAGFPLRASNALLSWWRYLSTTAWPRDLALLYPLPEAVPPWWHWGGALLALLAVTLLALRLSRRSPWLGAGWLWYLGTLLPVIGLVQVGAQARADRYTYLPLVGIGLAAAWVLAEAAGRLPPRRLTLAGLAAAILLVLAAVTRLQTARWRDSATLYRHTLAVTARNGIIHHQLANALAAGGDDREAVAHYRRVLAIQPLHVPTHNNLGASLARLGRTEEAAYHFRTALTLDPAYVPALLNLERLEAPPANLPLLRQP
jgi:tetratricopeptide (TPR) repeat protein